MNSLSPLPFVFMATSILLPITPSSAQEIDEAVRILPQTVTEGGTFGNRFATEGEWLAIGADFDAEVIHQGRVEIYHRESEDWVFHQELQAPDGFEGDHFGLPVSIRGDRMLVGMPWDDERGNRSGAVHVYRLVSGDWIWSQKLIAGVLDNTGALFGASCSFGRDENEIIIGAVLESLESDTEGGAWVFRDSGDDYVLRQRLSLPGDQPAAYFGRSIDVENGLLAIGAPGLAGDEGFRHGGVAIYSIQNDQWSLGGVLIPANPIQYQVFGESLDLEGNHLAVGSPFESTFGEDFGAVHVYRMIGGIPLLESVFGPPEPVRSFGFPVRFDPSARRLVCGAYAATIEDRFQTGAAWIHERKDGNWNASTRLKAGNAGPGDFFGLDLAFNEDMVFVGVPRSDEAAVDAGGVAVFRLEDCDDSGYLDAWEIDNGGDGDGNGELDACEGLLGDLNGDGIIDGIDFGIFSGLWGTDGSLGGDLNGDGIVNGGDLALILNGWT